ncbi:hypothetical protein [Leptospira ellinghausenii]
MHECGQEEYWFYHQSSHPDNNPLLYQELINNALSEIIVWDPYFNVNFPNSDQDIFVNIKNDITIKILTVKNLVRPNHDYLTSVHRAMKSKIDPAKDCRFGLRVINKVDCANHGKSLFHDRFLIIDSNQVYLIGSSIGWHLKSHGSTGIFKVSKPDTISFIQSIFKFYWDNSTEHEIPLAYLHLL